jgi:hypothetical protein
MVTPGCVVGAALAAFFFLAPAWFLVNTYYYVTQAANRTETYNNMRQIGLACHGHLDVHKTLPTPKMIVSKGGKTVELSWRVSILPFLEQQSLFDQFDRSRAWDTASNVLLVNSMPTVFQDAQRDAIPASTYFQYFTGPNTLWPANAPISSNFPKEIPDGSYVTILFAEAANAVPWSSPVDVAITPNKPIPLPEMINRERGSWFLACFADGSVRNLHEHELSQEILRSLIDPRDGRLIDLP